MKLTITKSMVGIILSDRLNIIRSFPIIINKRNVHIHGNTNRFILRDTTIRSSKQTTENLIPVNPTSLESLEHVHQSALKLRDWFHNKNNILCLTGAGISTDSGIPDYRGHNGSYHNGHKPMIHDQFMSHHKMRQRYWGRAMIGWRKFASSHPNQGHKALTLLEKTGKIGVTFEDSHEYYNLEDEMDDMRWSYSTGLQRLSVITQNVDGLHTKAGMKNVVELHGRNDILKCMSCGSHHCRHEFHNNLEELNKDWLQSTMIQNQLNEQNDLDDETKLSQKLRPDGDAEVEKESFDDILVPNCPSCTQGFLKPDVVFFGDSVPKHRVEKCYGAVDASDGLLCIGSSLVVHSAYRFVNRAANRGIPIAILNIGPTRAENNGLDVLKIEAPIGSTLDSLVRLL